MTNYIFSERFLSVEHGKNARRIIINVLRVASKVIRSVSITRGQCKHRNTPTSTEIHRNTPQCIYLPTEIHTELNSYGVSGCSVRFMHCF